MIFNKCEPSCKLTAYFNAAASQGLPALSPANMLLSEFGLLKEAPLRLTLWADEQGMGTAGDENCWPFTVRHPNKLVFHMSGEYSRDVANTVITFLGRFRVVLFSLRGHKHATVSK